MPDKEFKVTFKGVRGSIPSPMVGSEIQEKLTNVLEMVKPEDLKDEASRKAFIDGLPPHLGSCYGGNSSCVHARVGGHHLIFDAGSGLRVLGNELMKEEFGEGNGSGHLFLSHTHWDHILGIPFFLPLYIRGNQFTILGAHEDIKNRLNTQQKYEFFPVSFTSYGANIEFVDLKDKKEIKIGDVTVTWVEMDHPGKSYAYRVDFGGKSFVYATDAEYKKLAKGDLMPAIEFFRDTDLLIFDSQYTFVEGIEKEDWGHSSTFIGVDIAVEADVKRIAFYHHEPTYSDSKLVNIFQQTEKYLRAISPKNNLEMFLAQEGKEVDLLGD